MIQTMCNLYLKRRSYGRLKTNRAKPKREFFLFRSHTPNSKGVSQLRNHPLAHEFHLAGPYIHFAAVKWLRNLHALKSFSVHTMNGKVTNAPPFWPLLDTFRSLFKVHFMHTKCCFKSWEVKSLELQTVCKLELKRRSYGRLKTIVQTMS